MRAFVLAFAFPLAAAQLFGSRPSEPQVTLEEGYEYVTAGSTIQLSHVKSDTRLTLPQVTQQAITTQADKGSSHNFWRVQVAGVERGSPVECGSDVRLLNSDTQFLLHSHDGLKSPISGNQEVSGYDGNDDGDVWVVECTKEKLWKREVPVVLKHKATSKYLQSLPSKKYRQPIVGHQEVSAGKKADANAQWKALEGYYFNRVVVQK
ncbi:hypothetical protein DL89DRAFT_265648 [Linderina pennispora]|uniref:MIR domain-containing protein n=1 Tax=Linderina pennispora TaxID=61395 RepID=A0A1Y1WEI5_9FUNG|nr:uncharacterized protein DL89DRAFT_265648 [Linderina pennispora]ORX71941.1 hypothetical protein DL89DRAFT_265648 [Linderina pennispora]